MFTDAADTAATRRDAAARDLREVGIRIVAVLTGKSHASALESVVTKPPYANLLTADSFAGIDTVAVARTLCPPSHPRGVLGRGSRNTSGSGRVPAQR